MKNKKILKEIAKNLKINSEDIIVEIGGGHGELSQFLLKAKKLIIYEIDKNLAEKLKEKFSNYQNIEIKNENFLNANLESFNHQYKLIGNIPYSITGLILRKAFDIKNYPQIFVLTLQKELGEKILKEGSFLSNWLKIWAKISKVDIIKNKNFYPRPKVDSIILKIEFYQKPLIEDPENFAKFLKKLFKQPKKMIKNNIKLPENFKYLETLRPHQLKFEEIISIYKFKMQISKFKMTM